MRFLDLTQDFSLHTPAFAGYPGPAIRWIKRLAFEKAGVCSEKSWVRSRNLIPASLR